MPNPEPPSETGRMWNRFWKIPAVPRSLTCAAMLIIGVRLADACAVYEFPVPTVEAVLFAFVSLLAATILHRSGRVR